MPLPIAHTQSTGTVKVWDASSVARMPEDERPGGESYEPTADEIVNSVFKSEWNGLYADLESKYKYTRDNEAGRNMTAEIPDNDGGIRQCGDGWFRTWKDGHWHTIYAGENADIDAAYRGIWETSGFCLRWDSLTEEMLDYNPSASEYMRYRGVDVSLLGGRSFEIGGSRIAYRNFIRWCETAPRPVEVRKDAVRSPNDFRLPWVSPVKDWKMLEGNDPLKRLEEGVLPPDTYRALDTSIMIPPQPEIAVAFRPVADPSTGLYSEYGSDSSYTNYWQKNAVIRLAKMNEGKNITNQALADMAVFIGFSAPSNSDPSVLEAANWASCKVDFVLCGNAARVTPFVTQTIGSPVNPEKAIIAVMAYVSGSVRVGVCVVTYDKDELAGNPALLDDAMSAALTTVKNNSGVGGTLVYTASYFDPVLNYASYDGSPGFVSGFNILSTTSKYPIRIYRLTVSGVMKNGQRLSYNIVPWWNGHCGFKNLTNDTFIGKYSNHPHVFEGPEIPDASVPVRHTVDFTNPSTHRFLCKKNLMQVENGSPETYTADNLIGDSLRPKLNRRTGAGGSMTASYLNNQWAIWSSAYGDNISLEWKTVANTNNPLYNSGKGATRVFRIEKVTGDYMELRSNIPVKPNTTYTLSVYARGVHAGGSNYLRLMVWTSNSMSGLNSNEYTDTYTSNVTPTTAWMRYSYTFTTGASTKACGIFFMAMKIGDYTSGDYLELCAPALRPGSSADWTRHPADTWPLPSTNVSAYSPDSPEWADYYQMVQMPNIWCAPYDQGGLHEFWISTAPECPPGMIPWFVNTDEFGEWIPAGKYKLLSRYSVHAPMSKSIDPAGGNIKYTSTIEWKTSGVDLACGSGHTGHTWDWAVPSGVVSGDASWNKSPNPSYTTDPNALFAYSIDGTFNTVSNWENAYLYHMGPDLSPSTWSWDLIKKALDSAGLYALSYWEYHVLGMIKSAYYAGQPRFDKFLPVPVFAYAQVGGWTGSATMHHRDRGQADWAACAAVDGSLGDTYTEGTGIAYIQDYRFPSDNHSANNIFDDDIISCEYSLLQRINDPNMAGVDVFMWMEALYGEIQSNCAGVNANQIASLDHSSWSDVPACIIVPADQANSQLVFNVWDPRGRQLNYKSGKTLYNGNGVYSNRSIADMDAWGMPTLLADSWANPSALNGYSGWTRAMMTPYDWQASFGISNGRSYTSWFGTDLVMYTALYAWGQLLWGGGFASSSPVVCPWSSNLKESSRANVNGGGNGAFATLDCITDEDL